MQQKYCDQGRSVALLKITRPMLRARSSCGSGGKPRNASIFPSANNSIGLGEILDIPCRIEADMRSDAADEDVLARAQSLNTDRLALEIRHAADAFPCKQFKAADVLAGEHRNWFSGVDRHHEGRSKVRCEVDLAAG